MDLGLAGKTAVVIDVLQHRLAAVRRDDAEVASATSRTWFSYERIIAPGWKAVIWLLSRSVVMNACAVYRSSSSLT